MNKFAHLMSDSDNSDNSDTENEVQTQVAPTKLPKVAASSPVKPLKPSVRQPVQEEEVNLAGFVSVGGKKRGGKNAEASPVVELGNGKIANGKADKENGSNTTASSHGQSPSRSPAHSPENKVKSQKKKKAAQNVPKANNAFAALLGDDSDEDSEEAGDGDETETDVDSDADYNPSPQTVASQNTPAPIVPATKSESVDYFGVLNLVNTCPDDVKKTTEIIQLAVLFVNTKTKVVDFEFSMYVYPTQKLTDETIEATGITQEMVAGGQPLDEVLRQFDRFLKEKNLFSSNRNKRKAGGFASEMEFLIVTHDVNEIRQTFAAELNRKQLTAPPCWKKFVDLGKTLATYYKKSAAPTVEEMLSDLVLEPKTGELARAHNLVLILSTLLTDDMKIVANEDLAKKP